MVEGPVDTIHHFGTLNSCRSLPNEIASNVLVKSDKWSVFDTLQNDNLVSNFKSFISLICKKLWTVIIWAGYTKIIEKLWLEWQTYFFLPQNILCFVFNSYYSCDLFVPVYKGTDLTMSRSRETDHYCQADYQISPLCRWPALGKAQGGGHTPPCGHGPAYEQQGQRWRQGLKENHKHFVRFACTCAHSDPHRPRLPDCGVILYTI